MPKVKTARAEQDTDLSKRVDSLERELANLKRVVLDQSRGGGPAPHPDLWKLNFGRFKDDPTYEEAMRLGRAWRRRQPKC